MSGGEMKRARDDGDGRRMMELTSQRDRRRTDRRADRDVRVHGVRGGPAFERWQDTGISDKRNLLPDQPRVLLRRRASYKRVGIRVNSRICDQQCRDIIRKPGK